MTDRLAIILLSQSFPINYADEFGYTHKDILMAWFTDFVEIIFSLGLFINAILFIPQIIKLFRTKSTEGVSLLTFGGFWLIQLFIVFHGIIKHDALLVIGYIFSLITCGTVVALIIFYRTTTQYPER